MEMIGVGLIIFWRQNGREQPTRPVANLAQEAALRSRRMPVAEHVDALAIGQPKANQVDRIGMRMLAERTLSASIEPPAAVAARMVDLHDTAVEMLAGGGLEHLALEMSIAAATGQLVTTPTGARGGSPAAGNNRIPPS